MAEGQAEQRIISSEAPSSLESSLIDGEFPSLEDEEEVTRREVIVIAQEKAEELITYGQPKRYKILDELKKSAQHYREALAIEDIFTLSSGSQRRVKAVEGIQRGKTPLIFSENPEEEKREEQKFFAFESYFRSFKDALMLEGVQDRYMEKIEHFITFSSMLLNAFREQRIRHEAVDELIKLEDSIGTAATPVIEELEDVFYSFEKALQRESKCVNALSDFASNELTSSYQYLFGPMSETLTLRKKISLLNKAKSLGSVYPNFFKGLMLGAGIGAICGLASGSGALANFAESHSLYEPFPPAGPMDLYNLWLSIHTFTAASIGAIVGSTWLTINKINEKAKKILPESFYGTFRKGVDNLQEKV